LRKIVAQKRQQFGLLLSEASFLDVRLNKQFQCVVCCGYFKNSVVACCIGFGLSSLALMLIFETFLACDCFGHFLQNLATFYKIWPLFTKFGQFFPQSSGHLGF
jgi:hypothetical protein